MIIVSVRVIAAEVVFYTSDPPDYIVLPMISLCRVLPALTVLFLLALTLRAASAQEAVELTVDQPLKSPPTAELFEAPILLMVNDLPLNADKKVTNISPTLYDIDGDGKPELIVGGVSGELGIHRNENASQAGDPVWGPRQVFEDASGEAITLTNW